MKKPHLSSALSMTTLFCIGLSLVACSDVNLSYGVGIGGLTSISDRNRNAAQPGAFEDLDNLNLTPTPTPHRGSGDSIGGETSGEDTNSPPEATPSSAPSVTPESPRPVVEGNAETGEGRFRLRLIPDGPIELDDFGDRQLVQIIITDLEGNTLNLEDYTLIWEFEDPLAVLSEDGKYVVSQTEKGVTRVKISVEEDPDTFVIVDVLIGQSPSSGGGGGGGGGGGTSPTPTPSPADTVTGVVIFS